MFSELYVILMYLCNLLLFLRLAFLLSDTTFHTHHLHLFQTLTIAYNLLVLRTNMFKCRAFRQL